MHIDAWCDQEVRDLTTLSAVTLLHQKIHAMETLLQKIVDEGHRSLYRSEWAIPAAVYQEIEEGMRGTGKGTTPDESPSTR